MAQHHITNRKEIKSLLEGGEALASRELLKIWKPDQIRYMLLLAKPRKERQSDIEIAKELGVSTMTLWHWKNTPGFWGQVYEFVKSDLGSELVEVWRSVILQAKSGDINAAKLVLQEVARIEDQNYNEQQAIINILASQGITINVGDRVPEEDDYNDEQRYNDDKLEVIPNAEKVLSIRSK